jgi:hypothetical protein
VLICGGEIVLEVAEAFFVFDFPDEGAGEPNGVAQGQNRGATGGLIERNSAQVKPGTYIQKRRRQELICWWHGVLEVVEVLFVFDFDDEFAGEANELAGAGIRGDGDEHLLRGGGHRGGVLQNEGTGAAMERASDAFDGDVGGGAGFGVAGGEHLSLASGFEVAVQFFVEGEAGDGSGGFKVGRRLRSDFDFKGAGGVRGHGSLFLEFGWNAGGGG